MTVESNKIPRELKGIGAKPTPLVVAITGASGSGKTTFAERLRQRLGRASIMISHDDYYKHFPEMTEEEAAVYDFDSLDALDNDLFVEHLGTLKAGKPVEIPSYDFATHAHVEPYKSKANLVIPDGSDGLTFELVAQGILGLRGLQ